jgi:chromosome partitioning protein
MHVIVALLEAGYRVGSIDLDPRQATLTRYIENRTAYAEGGVGHDLKLPHHRRVDRSVASSREEAEVEERARFDAAFADLGDCGFIVIDTPGSDTWLSRLGHAAADTLVTPLNDSFLDIDVLATIDCEKRVASAPSHYTKMVWETHNDRVLNGRAPVDWVVMRNRLSHIDARNKRDIADLLQQLAQRIGFRLIPGFGERVVFRELFPKGLTLFDQLDPSRESDPNPSQSAARREIYSLLSAIGLPEEVMP